MPTVSSPEPARMIAAGRRPAARLPATSAVANIVSDSGRERQAGLQGVVLEHHLQVDRQRDHRPAERDRSAASGTRRRAGTASCRNRSGSSSVGLPSRLRRDEPAGERAERDEADRDQEADELPALLPDEDADHDAAHADGRQDRADDVDAARARVRHVADQPRPLRTTAMTTTSSRNADAPRQEGREEAAEQRADGGGDRGGGADQRVRLASARRPGSCRGSATASPAAAATRRARR